MIRPFEFFCQKVLPLVYDDSLSYYEVLCKVRTKLNEIIESQNDVSSQFSGIIERLGEFEAEYRSEINRVGGDVTKIDAKLDRYITSNDSSIARIASRVMNLEGGGEFVGAIAFDGVDQMMEEGSRIVPGTVVYTRGYRYAGDGGDYYYVVTNNYLEVPQRRFVLEYEGRFYYHAFFTDKAIKWGCNYERVTHLTNQPEPPLFLMMQNYGESGGRIDLTGCTLVHGGEDMYWDSSNYANFEFINGKFELPNHLLFIRSDDPSEVADRKFVGTVFNCNVEIGSGLNVFDGCTFEGSHGIIVGDAGDVNNEQAWEVSRRCTLRVLNSIFYNGTAITVKRLAPNRIDFMDNKILNVSGRARVYHFAPSYAQIYTNGILYHNYIGNYIRGLARTMWDGLDSCMCTFNSSYPQTITAICGNKGYWEYNLRSENIPIATIRQASVGQMVTGIYYQDNHFACDQYYTERAEIDFSTISRIDRWMGNRGILELSNDMHIYEAGKSVPNRCIVNNAAAWETNGVTRFQDMTTFVIEAPAGINSLSFGIKLTTGGFDNGIVGVVSGYNASTGEWEQVDTWANTTPTPNQWVQFPTVYFNGKYSAYGVRLSDAMSTGLDCLGNYRFRYN